MLNEVGWLSGYRLGPPWGPVFRPLPVSVAASTGNSVSMKDLVTLLGGDFPRSPGLEGSPFAYLEAIGTSTRPFGFESRRCLAFSGRRRRPKCRSLPGFWLHPIVLPAFPV